MRSPCSSATPSRSPLSADAAWERWERKGVAQFRQPHNFMPGLRLLLEAELPDVQDALGRAGADRFDLRQSAAAVLRRPRAAADRREALDVDRASSRR